MGKPRKYDLTKRDEIKRWFEEMKGYLRCGEESNKDFIHQGTDFAGRKFAYVAFFELEKIVFEEKGAEQG